MQIFLKIFYPISMKTLYNIFKIFWCIKNSEMFKIDSLTTFIMMLCHKNSTYFMIIKLKPNYPYLII